MKKITFADLIKADLKWSRMALNGTDETDIFIAAYHCQQAVEKTCGYIAQRIGIKSIRTHDIAKWADYLKNNSIDVPTAIANNADEISEWESKSRYNINFYAMRHLISQIADETEKWLSTSEAIAVRKKINI